MNSESIQIIHRNEEFIVVYKPNGMNFHSEDNAGLAVLVKEQLSVDQLYPVHRLDKLTSGLIVFALTVEAAKIFGGLFESNKVKKTYLAISDKKPKKKQGMIKGDMERSRRKQWILKRSMDNPAITRFNSWNLTGGMRLFVVKPLTGKTHQIRVALKSLGAPILGDDTYGGNVSDRGYLHAYRLSFNFNGESFEFIADPKQGEEFRSDEYFQLMQNEELLDYLKDGV